MSDPTQRFIGGDGGETWSRIVRARFISFRWWLDLEDGPPYVRSVQLAVGQRVREVLGVNVGVPMGWAEQCL